MKRFKFKPSLALLSVMVWIVLIITMMAITSETKAEEAQDFSVYEFEGTGPWEGAKLNLIGLDGVFVEDTEFDFVYPGKQPVTGTILILSVFPDLTRPDVYSGELEIYYGSGRPQEGEYLARFKSDVLEKFRLVIEGSIVTFKKSVL